MNVRLARRIDLIAGYIVLLGLRVTRLFFRRDATRTQGTPPDLREVLIIKCFGFGSILQMMPLLASLKRTWPGVRVTLLTFRENAEIGRLIQDIDQVETIEFRRGIPRFLVGTLRAIRVLRRRDFDLILDCEFFSYFVAILAEVVRKPSTIVIGFFGNRRGLDWIFRHVIAIDLSQHISTLFHKMLAPLDVAGEPERPESFPLSCGTADFDKVDGLLRDWRMGSGDLIVVININASDLCLNRRWPLDHFARLIHLLTETEVGNHIAFALIGGKEDVAYVGALARQLALPSVHDLAGKLTIPELAALMTRSALFVGNDSGPLHLAAACGVPTVSFFGPETPNLYGPVGPRHRILHAGLHCSPCLNIFYSKDTRCNNNICMQQISPEEAASHIAAFLSNSQS